MFATVSAGKGFLRLVKPFDGWSVCLKDEDGDELEQYLVSMFDWTGKQSNERQRGRPRKRETAAKLYRSLYPDGHESKGLTWSQVADEVGEAGKISVGVDTLRRGLAEI